MTRADDKALELLRLLWEVQHALERSSKHMSATIGVTGPQRLVLRMIAREPDILASEIARRAHLHPSTISGILRRLELRGLVTRRRGTVDTRAMRLRTTPSARPITRRSAGTIESSILAVMARASPVKIRHSVEVLSLMVAALEPRTRARPPGRPIA